MRYLFRYSLISAGIVLLLLIGFLTGQFLAQRSSQVLAAPPAPDVEEARAILKIMNQALDEAIDGYKKDEISNEDLVTRILDLEELKRTAMENLPAPTGEGRNFLIWHDEFNFLNVELECAEEEAGRDIDPNPPKKVKKIVLRCLKFAKASKEDIESFLPPPPE